MREAQSQHKTGPNERTSPSWLWWGNLGLLIVGGLLGLGLVAALALGWRSPTPIRAPDHTVKSSAWQWHGDGATTVTDTGYQLHLSQPGQQAWAIPTPGTQAAAIQQVDDFDLELDTRALISSADAGYGLLYRYQNPDNFYLFAIGSDGYYTIAVVQDGALIPLRAWQQWPHVRRGAATNRLRVRCKGSTCRFHINGEFTAEVIDDTFLAGGFGLWGQTFSDTILKVVFEETRLWSLN
jgi:hypothetical protein